MQIANDFVELGFSTYMAQEISEDSKRRVQAAQDGKTWRHRYFIVMFRKRAKNKGMDIDKFI